MVGQNAKLVEQVLYILSYFIRCTEVFEHSPKRVEEEKESTDNEVSNSQSKTTLSCTESDETETCQMCRRTCEKLRMPSKTVNNLHLFVREGSEEDILGQLGIDRITPCSKCGLLKHASNIIPNAGVPKELRQFVKDVTLTSKAGQGESFYCCCQDEEKNYIPFPKESTFQCYCSSYDGGKDCPSKGLTAKCSDSLVNGEVSRTDAQHVNRDPSFVGNVDKVCNCCKVKLKQDSKPSCDKSFLPDDALERVRNSETDSCLSMESGSFSMQKSIEETSLVDESISSCGRCGSTDSGIHQSPLNSPCIKNGVSFMNSVDDVAEEDLGPIELSLPRSVQCWLGYCYFCTHILSQP